MAGSPRGEHVVCEVGPHRPDVGAGLRQMCEQSSRAGAEVQHRASLREQDAHGEGVESVDRELKQRIGGVERGDRGRLVHHHRFGQASSLCARQAFHDDVRRQACGREGGGPDRRPVPGDGDVSGGVHGATVAPMA